MWLPLRFGMCAGKPRAPRCFAPAFFFFFEQLETAFFIVVISENLHVASSHIFSVFTAHTLNQGCFSAGQSVHRVQCRGKSCCIYHKIQKFIRKTFNIFVFLFFETGDILAWSVWLFPPACPACFTSFLRLKTHFWQKMLGSALGEHEN